ncbi:MAG: Holliday junction resolvase RuvX [Candidatus Eremiobacteraeota bacterium]|nr:Holliday junction resolvase RuvX [Candidatus Eremiobacteraeota bacterium]
MIMALDVGSRRIGVAIAQRGSQLAIPLATIERGSRRDDLAQIQRYLDSYAVDELVIGDPLTLAGERGVAARAMDSFVEEVRRIFGGAIHRVDERMTTAQATKTLIAADVSRRKRREIVDRMAAALILETFLATRRFDT